MVLIDVRKFSRNHFYELKNFTCLTLQQQMHKRADRWRDKWKDVIRRQEDSMRGWWKKRKTTEGARTGHHPSGRPDQEQEQLSYPVAPSRSKVTAWPIFEHNQGCNRDISHILALQRLQSRGAHVGYGSVLSLYSKERRGRDLKDIGS